MAETRTTSKKARTRTKTNHTLASAASQIDEVKATCATPPLAGTSPVQSCDRVLTAWDVEMGELFRVFLQLASWGFGLPPQSERCGVVSLQPLFPSSLFVSTLLLPELFSLLVSFPSPGHFQPSSFQFSSSRR